MFVSEAINKITAKQAVKKSLSDLRLLAVMGSCGINFSFFYFATELADAAVLSRVLLVFKFKLLR